MIWRAGAGRGAVSLHGRQPVVSATGTAGCLEPVAADQFQPGDIQLLNNAKILHAREAYTDYDDPAERRHLLRLWLTAHASASV